MGRNRTRLTLTPAAQAELERCLRTATHERDRERLQFIVLAKTGRHTLADLARRTGRVRATMQNWLAKFEAGGVPGLLDRDTPPGMASPLATGRIQRELRAGLRSGRLRTAAQVAAWLKERHGVKRSRKSIYYWLNKRG